MSNAERDPHVLISARIGGSQKLLSLPSHRHRWGWIVMLGQAKLQRPPGRFESLAQAKFAAGVYRDCVAPWMNAGLLHAAPVARACRCGAQFDDLRDPEVVVHDWRAHQERSRTQAWRESKGIPNGHVNLSGETVGKQRGNNGETLTPRAPTRALQSQSLSTVNTDEEETTAVIGPDRDSLDTYHELTGWRPWGVFSGEELRAAIELYGDAAVDGALRQESQLDGDRKTLLNRTKTRLAKEAERQREVARRKPKPKVTPLDRKAVNAELLRLQREATA